MKSLIVYYSQTGNTREMARAIRDGIAGTGTCDLARLQDVTGDELARCDFIGLGSPVWHRREPANVLSFIESSLKGLEGKPAFVFCTHGLYPGHFIGRVVAALRLEGLNVIGWRNWYASATLPEHPKPYFTDGHPDAIDLAEAREFGREMAEVARRVVAGEAFTPPELPVGRDYHDRYPGPGSVDRPDRRQNTEGPLELIDLRSFPLAINPDRCLYPRCTLCADNCPVGAINFRVSPPLFRTNCERCWFCEQICPAGAIEVDWKPIADFVDRYICDGWEKLAREAEAKGTLRRLVPPEAIDRTRYWYAQKSPPRLKPLKPD